MTLLVSIRPGVSIDLGGIAKGHAADLVAQTLMTHGASSVCVDLGGDIRVTSDRTAGVVWDVDVEDPFDATRTLHTWPVTDGAVATSSTLRRRWCSASEELHHIVDPRTGAPTAGPVCVSVLAGRASDAEVLTKVGMVAGFDALVVFLVDGMEALALHIGALIADSYVRLDLLDVLVPMRAGWRPGAVAWGIVAFYVLLVVEVTSTSFVRGRLPKRWWHAVHMTSLLAFVASTIHGCQAGTDARRPAIVVGSLVVVASVVGAIAARVMHRGPRRTLPTRT